MRCRSALFQEAIRKQRARVLEAVLAREKPAACREIAIEIEIPLRSVSKHLFFLFKKGMIDRGMLKGGRCERNYYYGRPEVIASSHLAAAPANSPIPPRTTYTEEGDIHPEAFRAMIAAMVMAAVETAQGKDGQSRGRALRWLSGRDCKTICCFLGVNWESMQASLACREEETIDRSTP